MTAFFATARLCVRNRSEFGLMNTLGEYLIKLIALAAQWMVWRAILPEGTTVDGMTRRGMLVYALDFATEKIGSFDVQLVEEFFIAFAANAGLTLHLRQLSGRNSHHIAEGAFKAAARALREAVSIDPELEGEVPSTKGVLA